MFHVKVYKFRHVKVYEFKLWNQVQAFLANRNPAYAVLITNPNGRLVFPDSSNGEPVKIKESV